MLSLSLTILRLLKAIFRSWELPEFRAAFVLSLVILISGTVFYRSVEGWSWVDAFYFSATTISTVGLGDIAPATDLGKVFTVIYIFVGVGVFVTLFSQLARALLQKGKDEEGDSLQD